MDRYAYVYLDMNVYIDTYYKTNLMADKEAAGKRLNYHWTIIELPLVCHRIIIELSLDNCPFGVEFPLICHWINIEFKWDIIEFVSNYDWIIIAFELKYQIIIELWLSQHWLIIELYLDYRWTANELPLNHHWAIDELSLIDRWVIIRKIQSVDLKRKQ